MGGTLENPRLMVELLPTHTSFGPKDLTAASKGRGGPRIKAPQTRTTSRGKTRSKPQKDGTLYKTNGHKGLTANSGMAKTVWKSPTRIRKVLWKGRTKAKGKEAQKAKKATRGGNGECRDAVATTSVIGFSITRSIDRGIAVLDGANLRPLRGGMGLRSPGILEPAYRVCNPFWKAVRYSLFPTCSKDILTSATIMYTALLNVLEEKF